MRTLLKPCALLALAVAGVLAVGAGSASPGSAAVGKYQSTVPDCPSYTLTHPFTPWLDPGSYFQVPGGSFETGTPGWALVGGAAVVTGNESFYVNSPADTESLSIPQGSSATSPSVCVSLLNPDARLFVRNTGSALSLLRVGLNYTDASGRARTALVGLLPGLGVWTPSLPILFITGSILPIVGANGQTWVSFTFTSIGLGGKWQIDDFYVDPLKNH
jgi:hypothetical protein